MKILVTVPFQKEHQEELKKAAPDALFFFKDAYTIDDKRDEKLYHALLKEADIIIGNPSIEEIASAPNLKFVQSSNAGVEIYAAARISKKCDTVQHVWCIRRNNFRVCSWWNIDNVSQIS